MKLKEITLRGFRGFNCEQSIPLHDRLTLISAPNSHGKTSISEGFEWLLYGFTSKVALADSKDEYKGSYRNIHLLQPESPTVRVTVQEGTQTSELQASLSGASAVLRVNGAVVNSWPFSDQLGKAPKPFILQHALKDLLLAAPVDRFNRFATLLGFDELSQVHKDLMAFCTKAPLPAAAKALIADVDSLVLRLEADQHLAPIAKSIKKGHGQLAATRSLVKKCARSLVPPGDRDSDALSDLRKRRDDAIAKVFGGTVLVAPFGVEELRLLDGEEKDLLTSVSSTAASLFSDIIRESAQHQILRKLQFYDLGVEFLQEQPLVCPFCAREITQLEANHVQQQHTSLINAKSGASSLENAQKELEALLSSLDQRLSAHYRRVANRTKGLLTAKGSMQLIQDLLTNDGHTAVIADAMEKIGGAVSTLIEKGKAVRSAIGRVQAVVRQPVSQMTLVVELGETVTGYVASARELRAAVTKYAPGLQAANTALIEKVNSAAGTKTLSLVIDLVENDKKIEKRLRIGALIDGLKDLKASVDMLVTQIMLHTISGELAADVMEWYNRIRTVGDPDVHFAGFDMKRTAQGGRIQIKASSYGKELVSAVSSLSESKLNALGLCISIAINLKEESPFDFLIIDDPIQSWDKDHEMQFINVIRELIERGKQIVLLSHNGEWIKQVRAQCADMNGLYYEITGYMDTGPIIKSMPWVEPKH